MSERDAWMRAISAQPDEDTPRLAFADWLDENGDDTDRAWAEFIRLQCALARGQLTGVPRVQGLRRVVELLSSHEERWRPMVPQVAGAAVVGNYDRGFLTAVQVSEWGKFRPAAADLFRTWPVTWLDIYLLDDPGELAGMPFLESLGKLSLRFVQRPTLESWISFASAPHLRNLRRVVIAGPRLLPPEREMLLSKRFGSRLTRLA